MHILTLVNWKWFIQGVESMSNPWFDDDEMEILGSVGTALLLFLFGVGLGLIMMWSV